MNRAGARVYSPPGVIGLCVALFGALAFAGGKAAPRGVEVEAVMVEGAHGVRAALRCVPERGAQLEVVEPVRPYGARPLGPATFVSLARKEGMATCIADDGGRGAWRARAMQIRAVELSAPQGGDRAVVTIDGQALGPRVAPDDGVYLVGDGAILRADLACPEARATDDRVVACAQLSSIRGRGPLRVRVQAAGRVSEAGGAPLAVPR